MMRRKSPFETSRSEPSIPDGMLSLSGVKPVDEDVFILIELNVTGKQRIHRGLAWYSISSIPEGESSFPESVEKGAGAKLSYAQA